MPNIIILSDLKLWSMAIGKGAPSFYNTVKGYCDAGWNTVLVNPDSRSDIEKNDLHLLSHEQVKIPFPNAARYRKIGYLGKLINQQNLYFQFCKSIKKAVKENKWSSTDTVFYAYEVAAVRAAKQLSKKFHCKLVTRFQGTIISPDKKSFRIIDKIRQYPHQYSLGANADAVIMTNDGTLGDKVLKTANNQSNRIFFWRNGVNRPNFDSLQESSIDIKSDDQVLMTVSRLENWKRIDRAIKALSEVVTKYPKCKLIIVGEGTEKPNLEALTKQLNLTDKVVFTGSLSQNLVYQYMKRADIFLSLYDLSNVGNPLMEAMMCGKAIITLNNGGTGSIIKHNENGVLLEMGEIDQIPIYICKLLENKDYKSRLSMQAKQYANKEFWTWKERINTEINTIGGLINE